MTDNSEKISSKAIIRICKVLAIEGNMNTASNNPISKNSFGRRIKVRLHEDDQNVIDENLPWVFPMLPKHLQITPKVGEMVLVFTESLDKALGNRFYMGPIISQDYYLDNGGGYEAMSLLQGISTKPICHPKGNGANIGTYPDEETVAIQGRGAAAMWLKEKELRLMCGHKLNYDARSNIDTADPGSLEFNKKLGYIQLKYNNFNQGKPSKEFNSVINVVADRINLLTYNGIDKTSMGINPSEQKELMTNTDIEKFTEEGQKMVLGDNLVAFLYQFREIFKNHVHNWLKDKSNFTEEDKKFFNKDLYNELLCKTIRIA